LLHWSQAFQVLIIVGCGIFLWLQMREDRTLRERVADLLLDLLGKIMAALDRPCARHQDM